MAGQSRAGASWNEREGKGGTLRSFIEIGSAAIDQAFLKYRAEENSAASVRHGRRDQTAEPNRRPFPKYRAIDVYSRLARPGDDGPATAVSSARQRSEEHTSELQSLMRISYAVFCLKKKNINNTNP